MTTPSQPSEGIPPAHLKIETWPSRELGGQHAGPGPSGIRVTHLPSGIFACCETERSQHKNKDIAMSMIEAAVTHPYYRGTI